VSPKHGLTATLNWKGDFSLEKFFLEKHCEEFICPGIYLFTEPVPAGEGECISYIGRSVNLKRRLLDHYLYHLAGIYYLPGKVPHERDWDLKDTKPENLKVLFSLPDYQELVAKTFAYARKLNIYVAVETSNKQLTEIEQRLIYDLLPLRNGSSIQSCGTPVIHFSHRGKLNTTKLTELKKTTIVARERCKFFLPEIGDPRRDGLPTHS